MATDASNLFTNAPKLKTVEELLEIEEARRRLALQI
jgi:hypothetical protein